MSNFSDQWKPPYKVMQTIENAARYDVLETDRKFSTGRPMVQVSFMDRAGNELTRRQGMVLHSKRTGNNYVVCRATDAQLSYRPNDSEMLGVVENCHTTIAELYN